MSLDSLNRASTPSRGDVLDRAASLRAAVLGGAVPYPDAILRANEQFIDRFSRMRGDTADRAIRRAERVAWVEEAAGTASAAVGAAGAVAVAFYATMAPPALSSVVLAASGALACSYLFSLCKSLYSSGAESRKIAAQARKWLEPSAEKLPLVPGSGGAVLDAGLVVDTTKPYAEGLGAFPYGDEVKAEHATTMALAASHRSEPLRSLIDQRLAAAHRRGVNWQAAGRALTFLTRPAWAATAAATAAGSLWLALGLGTAAASLSGLRALLLTRPDHRSRALQDARNLHFWDNAMASAPLPNASHIVFGTDSKTEMHIERTRESVKIGGIAVPVQRGRDDDECAR